MMKQCLPRSPAWQVIRATLGFVLLSTACTAFAGGAPPWMQAQVGAPIPEHDEKTTAVMLYSEVVLTVQPNGQLKRLDREVYRILRPDGKDRGTVRVNIDAQTRVNSLHAWSIPADGKPYEVGERDAVETAVFGVADGELVSDLRTKILRIPSAVPGSIVGYEIEVQERPYQLTDEWDFEDTVPVRETHYTLQLPAGWSYKSVWLNHPETEPSSVGPTQTQWVIRDLKAIRTERYMPPWRGVAGRLVIALIPPKGQAAGFQSWSELGSWYQSLIRGRTDSSAQIKQKVAELTQSAPSTLQKVRALAAFVQTDIRYVAIELGIGGHQPHPANDVLVHRYGDCKDKVALLNAMLKEIGVDSYFFLINTVRGSIKPDTPANLGFNHAILAIGLRKDLDDPALLAVATHIKLGRILFFDPTDPLTPIGSLSGELQSNYGVLVTPDGGELISTPQLQSSLSSLSRTAKLTLDENGRLSGEIQEVWSGDMASARRAEVRASAQDSDVIKPVEAVAAESFGTFQIVKASMRNARVNDRPFEWQYTIEVPDYAKAAGELMVVRPRVIGTKTSNFLETPEPRRYPIELDGGERETDAFEIALPAGYEVEELPPPVSVDYGFASYQSKTESVGHALRYTRTFEIKELSVPVDKAGQLKGLLRIIAGDERNSALLKPAGPHH
jgi:transglutaminase-like putative cysteine protease